MTPQCTRCGGHGWVIVGYGETAGADACPVCIEGPEEMKLSFQPPEEDDPRDDDQRNNEERCLPCPFCGNDRNIAVANEKHDHSGGYFIACPMCEASTGLRYACGEDPRPFLVAQWNCRASPAPKTRGYMGSTPDGGTDDHDEPTLPDGLHKEVDAWFAKNTGLGGCSDKDVAELAEIFYGATYEGGRESVDDALAVVDSFGPGIVGLNDTYARQVLLAQEVRRLHADYIKAVQGRQEWRDAAIRARMGGVEADLRKALRLACDHIDMQALRISHSKDALLIEAACSD